MNETQPSSLKPFRRPRRLRFNEPLRSMVRDVTLQPTDLIAPLFVIHGKAVKNEIRSMPGQFQFSVDTAVEQATTIFDAGVPAVILFGIPESKDSIGSDASANTGIVQTAIREIKSQVPDLVVIADTCLCEYTDHGHCGILSKGEEDSLPTGYLKNDETLAVLNQVALAQAVAGADIVAPSGMIDGMVASIRKTLDEHDFQHVPIMSYSVKYASAFYGPFRDAADGAPEFGDRKSHQMDPAEKKQAAIEATLDIEEGADFLMVKPALSYLDVISNLRQQHPEHPLVAYNVSGEYSMIKAAACNGWLDERSVVIETLTAMKRAGADLIITYHAIDACHWLSE